METKEEILKKHFDKKGITNEHIHVAAYLSVLDAMNEYATQQVNLLNKPAVMQSAILPQDLRIGNIVFADLYDEKPILVESICSKNQDIFNSTTGEIPFTSLNPIELNEKWLEKMGFVRDDDTSYRWFILDRSVAYDLDDNCIRISDSWEFGKRKYVHELQNLIFFLSGIELAVA